MADTKIQASGNMRILWATEGTFADYENPTTAEINSALDISESISWNDFDFNLEASNQIEDPAITSDGKVIDRGYVNWGGSISFYYPQSFDDATSAYSLTYDALDQSRTKGFLVVRIDGEETSTSIQDGDLVHCFRVMTDGYAESVTGEEAFRYTVTFLPQGDYVVRAVSAGASANAVVLSASTLASSAGDVDVLTATFGGRNYTNGLTWTTSDSAVATVQFGVVTSVASGTATITATGPNGQTDTCAVTVS